MGLFKKAPQSILILRALQLGDLLCTTPAFRALRGAFPKARITLVGLPWAKSFVQRYPHYLDDFVEFPGWPGLPEQEPRLERIPAFLQEVQKRRFDLAIQMQGAGTITNPLVALFGARQSAGFALPEQFPYGDPGYFLYPDGEHEIRIWLRLLESLGITTQGEQIEFPIFTSEQAAFEQFCEHNSLEPGRYVCLHPGARDTARRLPPERFAAVGDALAARGFSVVITGSAGEQPLTQAVANHMHAPALDAAGQTDLGTLGLLLRNARLLVSNDTGVSHVAAAMQTPSVILFTTADPRRWGPLNHRLHHIIENSGQSTHHDVLAEVDDLLREEPTYDHRPA